MTSCTLKSPHRCDFKVGIVGCGNVGAAAAYAMLIDGTPTELVLFDRKAEKAEGLALDFAHSLSFFDYTEIQAGSDYSLLADCDLIFVTAGARQREGETRLDLVAKNKTIFADLIPRIVKQAPACILVIISNPVDVLTHEAARLSGFEWGRVFGTGTMLDTARFRYHLSERLCLSPKSVEAFILGEHGDSSFPVLSSANVAGKSLLNFEGMDELVLQQAYTDTREAAYRIIKAMGYTCYSIGMVANQIMQHVFQNERIVLPLSVPLQGQYGLRHVALSVPCVLDSEGVREVLEISLNEKEQVLLEKSAGVISSFL